MRATIEHPWLSSTNSHIIYSFFLAQILLAFLFFPFNIIIIIIIIFLYCAASGFNCFPASLWHGDLKAAVLFLCSFHHSQQMSSLFKIFNSLMINQAIAPTKIYNFMLRGLKMVLSARKKKTKKLLHSLRVLKTTWAL